MEEENNINKEDLINKINLRIKFGYFAVFVVVVFYIGFNVAEVINPAFDGMNDFIIFMLLACVVLSILDGYKIFSEFLELKLKEEKEKK